MSERPILILQMQRMGDLVLTFPLLLMLRQQYPDAPLWVVAEEHFYSGLMPLAPQVTFFPPYMAQNLTTQSYQLVINLSHRPEAAHIAASVRADEVIGPIASSDSSNHGATAGTTHIRGDWQLYRSSLTHNNRHNRFHWAELNALDVIPLQSIATSQWLPPQTNQEDQTRVGLFIAASEAAKRPEPNFWKDVALALLKRGYKPVLLGGPDDVELGRQIAREGNLQALNLCGRFSLEELCRLLASLRLLITPDTGPMHVAAWARTPVLNLSMGPVHPWETGPYQPSQHVLRSTISCTGCWHCKHDTVLCKQHFKADRIASFVHMLLKSGPERAQKIRIPSLQLWTSGRSELGCYALHSGKEEQPREMLARFWQYFFVHHLPTNGLISSEQNAPSLYNEGMQAAWADYTATVPHMEHCFRKALAKLGQELSLAIRKDGGPTKSEDFWASHPLFIRPLTGYMHMLLQNSAYHRTAYLHCLTMIEELLAIVSP